MDSQAATLRLAIFPRVGLLADALLVLTGTALVSLAASPELRRALGSAAAQRVAAGFSWDDYGRRAIGILRELHGRRKNS